MLRKHECQTFVKVAALAVSRLAKWEGEFDAERGSRLLR